MASKISTPVKIMGLMKTLAPAELSVLLDLAIAEFRPRKKAVRTRGAITLEDGRKLAAAHAEHSTKSSATARKPVPPAPSTL